MNRPSTGVLLYLRSAFLSISTLIRISRISWAPLYLLYTRFIPAGAGNRVSSRYLPRRTTVHPRGCGERAGSKGRTVNVYGSSPRVRGTDGVTYRCEAGVRFIPAGAGNGCREPACRNRTTVHPRGCGERNRHNKSFHRTAGSSPRVRGTDGEIIHPLANQRFIPARAGNSDACYPQSAPQTVHPRPCGEQMQKLDYSRISYGSSPPVRGTDFFHCFWAFPTRFIPARAGNSRKKLEMMADRAVHPRPCGEQDDLANIPEGATGSSPPVRGTGIQSLLCGDKRRFIPARAGNRTGRSGLLPVCSVHPRPCGERSRRSSHA